MLEVQPDLVTVLADTVERSEDLDKDRAEAAKKQAEALAHKGDLSPEDRARAIEQLTEAVARLHIDRRTPETALTLTPPKTCKAPTARCPHNPFPARLTFTDNTPNLQRATRKFPKI